MAEKIKKRVINLLPNKKEGFLEEFLTWALTVGRLLVIITETLALSVFLYRFVLDVKIIDLHDQIKADSAIIGSFQEGENTFRDLQKRLALSKNYDSKKDISISVLRDIVDLGKDKVTFKNIAITVNSINIEVQSPSGATLNAFVIGLKNNPNIQDVSIERVENSPSTGLVTIALSTKLVTPLQTPPSGTDTNKTGGSNQ